MIIKAAINDLKNGSILPIYYLKGGDQFLQSFFIQKVSESFFGDLPEKKTLMLPDDMKGKEILDRLTMSDLFASKKLFILRNPQHLKGKVGDDLLAYCQKPNENHVFE